MLLHGFARSHGGHGDLILRFEFVILAVLLPFPAFFPELVERPGRYKRHLAAVTPLLFEKILEYKVFCFGSAFIHQFPAEHGFFPDAENKFLALRIKFLLNRIAPVQK